MTRVQIYLDTKHLDILDFLAAKAGISRSQAIRNTIEVVGQQTKRPTAVKKNPLLEMAGFIKNAPKDLASNVDEIYTQAYHERKSLH